jgi:ABC-type branched-subunit amino acid transport system substrate-binding protein
VRTPKWRALALSLTLVVALVSCSRSGDESETGGDDEAGNETETTEAESGGDSRLASGEFGDLGVVCQDGDASAASDTGVTDTEIKIGLITDETAQESPGLNQEMYDTAEAFAAWCNEHGGINGRELVVERLDAALFSYGDRIADACNGDYFALVGGGAVFDDTDNGAREACGVPNLPAYVVSEVGRTAGLQVQPVPNPVGEFPLLTYQRVRELYPDATRYGVFWVDVGGVGLVHEQLVAAVESLGFSVDYDQVYAVANEQNWPTFVQNMQEADIQVVELIGEPNNMTALLQAMEVAGWYPEVITMQANMFDETFREEAASSIGTDVLLRSVFDFTQSNGETGMDDYFELMETYNPDGKFPALLGAQSLSGFLLFAMAATECGDELTRQCLLDTAASMDGWTAGGLHAPTSPGNEDVPECAIIVQLTQDEGFVYNEEATDPSDGIYNCDPESVLTVEE